MKRAALACSLARISLLLGVGLIGACGAPRTMGPSAGGGGAIAAGTGGAAVEGSGGVGSGGTGTGGAAGGTGAGGAGDPTPLTVHEWGTFTSVNSSAGALMEGMHHQEEALPAEEGPAERGEPVAGEVRAGRGARAAAARAVPPSLLAPRPAASAA